MTLEPRGDEQLLADHLRGQPGAFDVLVSRYANELFGFLSRFVGNAAAAEDLVQETFVQVYQSAGSFDPKRSFKPWLYTIAANKGRDFLRSRSRRQEFSIDASGPSDAPAPSQTLQDDVPELSEQLDSDETAGAVRELIEKMPEHLRLMLILGYYQQLPYAEIADIVGIPVGTVKSRLHAAVNHFARLWRGRMKSLRGQEG